MKLLIIPSLLFIAYEILKVFIMNNYWKQALELNRNYFSIIMEALYAIFLICLLFTHYWYISVGIFLISLVTASGLLSFVTAKIPMNQNIKKYLILDCIASVILLSLIIIKEVNL